MPRLAAFLRGINVGGHVVKMGRLREIFETAGLDNVETLLASGNVLFDTRSTSPPALERKIANALRKELGYDVATFVRSAADVTSICEHDAFPSAELKEGSLFVGLFATPLTAEDARLVASLQSPVDGLRVHGREVYWHARRHFANAQFSPAKMEKLLGRPATFRTIKTFRRVAALLAAACVVVAVL